MFGFINKKATAFSVKDVDHCISRLQSLPLSERMASAKSLSQHILLGLVGLQSDFDLTKYMEALNNLKMQHINANKLSGYDRTTCELYLGARFFQGVSRPDVDIFIDVQHKIIEFIRWEEETTNKILIIAKDRGMGLPEPSAIETQTTKPQPEKKKVQTQARIEKTNAAREAQQKEINDRKDQQKIIAKKKIAEQAVRRNKEHKEAHTISLKKNKDEAKALISQTIQSNAPHTPMGVLWSDFLQRTNQRDGVFLGYARAALYKALKQKKQSIKTNGENGTPKKSQSSPAVRQENKNVVPTKKDEREDKTWVLTEKDQILYNRKTGETLRPEQYMLRHDGFVVKKGLKIINKKDIDMGLGGDTMKSSDDDIANEISSSEMSDYEETVRDLKTGDFYDERPDTIYDPLDSDWKTAKEFHAGLAEIDTKLSQISWRLAYSFRAHMLETKDYGNYRQVADNLREQFFNIYFGNNNKIVQLGKKLLTNKERDAALSLNQAVRVIGDEIDYYFAVDKILWKCKRPQLLLNALNIVPPSFEIKLSEEDHAFILTTPIYSSKKFTSLTDVTNEIANVLQAHADKQFGYFVFGFVIVLVGLIFFVTFSF